MGEMMTAARGKSEDVPGETEKQRKKGRRKILTNEYREQ